MWVQRGDLVSAAEGGEFDEDSDACDLSAELSDEVAGGFHGAAGSEDVVTDEDSLAGFDAVGVHLEGVFAVFEVVGGGYAGSGELAWFSDESEACGEAAGDGGAEDEAPAFGADDEVDVFSAEGIGEEFDGEGEAGGIGEEWGDVAEEDAFFGEIGDFADERFEVFDGVVHIPMLKRMAANATRGGVASAGRRGV